MGAGWTAAVRKQQRTLQAKDPASKKEPSVPCEGCLIHSSTIRHTVTIRSSVNMLIYALWRFLHLILLEIRSSAPGLPSSRDAAAQAAL